MKKLLSIFLFFLAFNVYPQNYYAVIISSTYLTEEQGPSGEDSHWNDAFVLWEYCNSNYFINIRFLYGAGNDPGIGVVGPRYLPSSDVTTDPCTIEAVEDALNDFSSIMQYNDILVVYIKAHGYANGTSGYFELRDGDMSDTDFEELVKQVPCKKRVIIDASCYSGAFKDNFQDYKSIFMSSSDYDESSAYADDKDPDGTPPDTIENEEYEEDKYSHHGEFDYHILNALLKETVYYDNEVDADYDENGEISVSEMFTWAENTNSEDQTPQYYDFNNLGHRTYLNVEQDILWENSLVISNGIYPDNDPYLVWSENQDLSGITRYKIYRQVSECGQSPEGTDLWIGTT